MNDVKKIPGNWKFREGEEEEYPILMIHLQYPIKVTSAVSILQNEFTPLISHKKFNYILT